MMSSATAPNPRKQERRHHRFVVSWAAHVQTASGQSLPLRVIDVSHGGIGVVSDDMLPVEGAFGVTLQLPAPGRPGQIRNVDVLARVIHQVFTGGRNRAGLEFVRIAPADDEFLISCAQRRV